MKESDIDYKIYGDKFPKTHIEKFRRLFPDATDEEIIEVFGRNIIEDPHDLVEVSRFDYSENRGERTSNSEVVKAFLMIRDNNPDMERLSELLGYRGVDSMPFFDGHSWHRASYLIVSLYNEPKENGTTLFWCQSKGFFLTKPNKIVENNVDLNIQIIL